MVAIQRTFLGMRVWPTSMLKPYFPFIVSGTTAYFLFNWVAVKLKDDPTDKWTEIVYQLSDSAKTIPSNKEREGGGWRYTDQTSNVSPPRLIPSVFLSNIVRDASEKQKVKNEAADWYAAQIAKKEGKQ
ncbi:hypothetical protein CcCBS67573_g02884 [Chytriomyces confervae]|uniref:Uncharacterized protein n=1 Tax=Chytriomyces confervae TaxID=246404 RepID=A0A507FKH4_9FUNG|nr:hypothetical protein CcCBS67573_g02884 [Chytriomyces confervae]